MTDEDGHRIDAAGQFGFEPTDDDCERYACTHAQIIAFAKACERAGRAQCGRRLVVEAWTEETREGALEALQCWILEQNAASDAELAPILEAERVRFLAAHEAPILKGRHDDCAKPYDSRAAHVCVCHARMGNDFYFMPAGSCLEKSK